eukprot:GAHX01003196.1.p1 GENE.GAHX01003196.1~~GAHX01003196.1.p1  ORF type:complete len:239 (+),score=40.41 GAHX01003196.1:640-1356(+)
MIDLAKYYATLDEYAKMIREALRPFQQHELKDQLTKEETDLNSTLDLRFAYQELHLHTIVLAAVQIIKPFKGIMQNHLENRLKNHYCKELIKKVYGFFELIKKTMFTENNISKLSFNFKEKTENSIYVLTSFLHYKRFLILSIYMIFIHAFETNSEFEVTGFNAEFIEAMWAKDEQQQNDEEDEKFRNDYEKRILDYCGKIFLILFNVESPGGFFKIDEEVFDGCVYVVFDFGDAGFV